MTIDDEPWLIDGPQNASVTWILAHGAGAGMESPFMDHFARGVAGDGIRVIRFEFPYMRQRRVSGGRRPPNSARVLLETWRRVVAEARRRGGSTRHWVIGGKSMGGRLASLVADEMAVDALICLGFPFQAPGKSQPERLQVMRQLKTSTLILQGTRDPFGGRQQVTGYHLPATIDIHWLEDGDHDFKPRKSSGRNLEENWQEGVTAIRRFLRERGLR